MSEGLRGLLRPPLSWDSLLYHLPITSTWLQEGRIAPVFGMRPMSFYGYQPAGGSVWVWWWMAPSHSELYVNLAFFPQAVLFALAVGGVARELGARRAWPCAAFLSLLMPTVIRFVATQYVDILVGAGIVAAVFLLLRWLERSPRTGDAASAGAALGLASGAKVLGLAYALGLAPVALLLAHGERRARSPQVAAALLICVLTGGVFYARNMALGAGPLAARCDPPDASVKVVPSIPRVNTVAYLLDQMIEKGWLVDSFLGVATPGSLEMGVGPLVLLLLPAFLFPLGLRRNRHAAALVWSQIALQSVLWVTVPYASDEHVFANVRYLIGALGLATASVVAWAESRGATLAWLTGITLGLAAQDLLMLHSEMPRQVRLVLAALDIVAVALALSSRLRTFVVGYARRLCAAAVMVALLGSPFLARFRRRDRARAYFSEFTTHYVPTGYSAGAWRWLDLNGGGGTVAVANTPPSTFFYPAMGFDLERRVVYVNVNARDSRNAADYPSCDPRTDLDPDAWMQNLQKQGIRWLLLSRLAGTSFLDEEAWARTRPDIFEMRYRDDANVIYEFKSGAVAVGSPHP